MTRIPIALLSCFTVVAACTATPEREPVNEETEVVETAVEARVVGYLEAVQQRDLDYMLDFWADTEGFVFGGDGSVMVGYDAFAEQLREIMSEETVVNYIGKSNEQIYVLASDAASYTMEFEWSMTLAAGDTTRARGSWTYVFKRLDGVWKAVHSNGTHIYF